MPDQEQRPMSALDDANETRDDQSESVDEQVLDQLAMMPTPSLISDSDAIAQSEALPEDLPGRASGTTEDLAALFSNTTRQHLEDGFIGSGDEDGNSISQGDGDDTPDGPVHPAGA